MSGRKGKKKSEKVESEEEQQEENDEDYSSSSSSEGDEEYDPTYQETPKLTKKQKKQLRRAKELIYSQETAITTEIKEGKYVSGDFRMPWHSPNNIQNVRETRRKQREFESVDAFQFAEPSPVRPKKPIKRRINESPKVKPAPKSILKTKSKYSPQKDKENAKENSARPIKKKGARSKKDVNNNNDDDDDDDEDENESNSAASSRRTKSDRQQEDDSLMSGLCVIM